MSYWWGAAWEGGRRKREEERVDDTWSRLEEGKTRGGGRGEPAHGTAAITAPVALQGVIRTFDLPEEEWCEYTERLMHYFVASDIKSEDKKRQILLTVMGPNAYQLLKTLASLK